MAASSSSIGMAASSSSVSSMAASSSTIVKLDDEERDLQSLLDAFGSIFSLEDIASAFWKAGHDVDLAGEILFNMQGCTSSSMINGSCGKAKDVTYSESSHLNGFDESSCTNEKPNPKASSQLKHLPVSMGTVSSVIGKNYSRFTPCANKAQNGMKLSKLEANKLTISTNSREESSMEKDASLQKDFENFLFEMLGCGFQLDRDVIKEVLGHCGYDMEKSLEELLELTTKDLGKSNNFHEGIKKHSDFESPTCQIPLENPKSTRSIIKTNGVKMSRQQEKRYEQEKEILATLFTAPERPKSPQRAPLIQRRRSRVSWQVAVEPLKDNTAEWSKCQLETEKMSRPLEYGADEDDSFLALRQAVKEYRNTMKGYYKAAAEAFSKGERSRAAKLMEEGQFFFKKAQMADEESAERIFEISGRELEAQEELSIDLQNHDAKEAIRLVKCHLRSLAGIQSFTHLKILTGTDKEDASVGAHKRLVQKFLEKESINWTEDETSGAILIWLDKINPKHLSFVKNQV
ncbi:hypothetical protein Ancab_033828 [Ancistrocladus abbreviatus]